MYKLFLAGDLDRAFTQEDLRMLIPNPQGRDIKRMWEVKQSF